MTLRAAALLALAIALAIAAPAHADDEAAKNEARALLQGGNKLLEKGDRAGALALFESAYARYPSPLILINMGTTLRDLDRPAEAANAFARFVAAPGEFTDRVPKIKKLLAQLDRSLGAVTVTIEPADAEIAIGEAAFAPAGQLDRWRAPPGEVVVRARKDGYQPLEQTVTIVVGTSLALSLALERTPIATPAPTAPQLPGELDDEQNAGLHARVAPVRPARFGVTGRALIDGRGRGAAGSAGALVRVHDRVELAAGAIFANPGDTVLGAYAAAHLELGQGTLRPRLAAGFPVIFDDGARISGRGSYYACNTSSPSTALLLLTTFLVLLLPRRRA